MIPLNIYIHIPFCFAKCPYCAFYSCTQGEDVHEKYFDRLKEEILQKSEQYSDRKIGTIYIGGGTPNLVSEKYMATVVEQIKGQFNVKNNAEISIELYPQYTTKKQLEIYKEAGINRVSLGLQTTQDKDLSLLSRRYTYDIFLQKYKLLKRCDFKNIGVDLIFGYPTHTLDKWQKTLQAVTDLDIQHISAYSLEIEEGTIYGEMKENGSLNIPSDEINRQMYHFTCGYLDKKGFKQYEISNFCKSGHECNHNLNFWNYQDYLGLGAGAYSRIDGTKFNNPEDIGKYINGERGIIEKIDKEKTEKEKQILGLRLNKGIEYRSDIFEPEYMNRENNLITLNKRGKDFYNIVVEKLL